MPYLALLCQFGSYEVHFSARKSYAPSALMEKLIADTRSGSVLNVGLVIDATGSDTFLHDVKYGECGVVLDYKTRLLTFWVL
jgi:hypothetical protein